MNTTTSADSAIAATATSAPAITAPSAAALPSVHARAVITWLAIFPLVAMGMIALNPLIENWHPILRALLLTALVVPAAVYVVVPKLFAAYGTLMKRRALRASAGNC